MKIAVRKLRKIVEEATYGSSKLRTWAESVGLEVDIDPATNDERVLVSDEFAMMNGLPESGDWGVERSITGSGWIVMSTPDYGSIEFEEVSSTDQSDLDDIDIDVGFGYDAY